jgi:predicted MPP superfamily phosphohydrolase
MKMKTVDQLCKQTGIIYVYENHSYWCKEKKQPRSTRKLIGKRDKETGALIPTGVSSKKPISQKESFSQILVKRQ